MSRTLRGRLAIVSAVTFGLLLAVAGGISYRALVHWLDLDATMRLTELTEGLRGYLRFDGPSPRIAFDEHDPEISAFIHDATQFYQLYDAETGCALVQSDGARSFGLTFPPDQIRAFRETPRPVDVNTRRGRVRISNSVVGGRPEAAYLLQVGVSLAPTDAALRWYRHLLLYSMPAALVVAALTAWGLGGVALSPLVRVAEAARTIDVRSLGTRLPVRGTGDELDQVVAAFNGTLDRSSTERLGRCGSSARHSLTNYGTPLAILRGELELGLRQGRGQRELLENQLEQIRPAEAADRSDPHAGACRVWPDSAQRCAWSISAILRARWSTSSQPLAGRARDRVVVRTVRPRPRQRGCRMVAATADQSPR